MQQRSGSSTTFSLALPTPPKGSRAGTVQACPHSGQTAERRAAPGPHPSYLAWRGQGAAAAPGGHRGGRWQEKPRWSGHPLTFWFALCFGLRLDFGLLIQALLILVLGGAGCERKRKHIWDHSVPSTPPQSGWSASSQGSCSGRGEAAWELQRLDSGPASLVLVLSSQTVVLNSLHCH